MLFRRSLVSELVNMAGAVFTVIFSIVLAVSLVRILGMAAGGRIDSGTVFEMVVYQTLVNLGPILAASLFVSVLLALMRSWVDSEMVIWFSSGGISLFAWLRPVFMFSLPVIAFVALLSTTLSPWANSQSEKNSERFSQRDDISRLSPGRFIEGESGRQMFFLENILPDGRNIENVFVFEVRGTDERVIASRTGELEITSEGDRYVTLHDGSRYEFTRKSPEASVSDFKHFSQRLSIKPERLIGGSSDFNMMSPVELWKSRSPRASGEIFWRLSWPWAAFNLVLLAIPLSFTNPRGGRKFNLFIALLVFILYLNILGLGKDAIETSRIGWIEATLAANGLFTLLGILLMLRRTVFQLGLKSFGGGRA